MPLQFTSQTKQTSLFTINQTIYFLDQFWYPSETLPPSQSKLKGLSMLILGSKNLQKEMPMDKTGALDHLAQSRKGCKSRTLTYFEHKLPDEFSFPKAIAEGLLVDKGKTKKSAHTFLIISKLDPPYKLSKVIPKVKNLLTQLDFPIKREPNLLLQPS